MTSNTRPPLCLPRLYHRQEGPVTCAAESSSVFILTIYRREHADEGLGRVPRSTAETLNPLPQPQPQSYPGPAPHTQHRGTSPNVGPRSLSRLPPTPGTGCGRPDPTREGQLHPYSQSSPEIQKPTGFSRSSPRPAPMGGKLAATYRESSQADPIMFLLHVGY